MKQGTLLTCELVLERYLHVMTESNCPMSDIYKKMVVDAYTDIKSQREMGFLGLKQSIESVPNECSQASLTPIIKVHE